MATKLANSSNTHALIIQDFIKIIPDRRSTLRSTGLRLTYRRHRGRDSLSDVAKPEEGSSISATRVVDVVGHVTIVNQIFVDGCRVHGLVDVVHGHRPSARQIPALGPVPHGECGISSSPTYCEEEVARVRVRVKQLGLERGVEVLRRMYLPAKPEPGAGEMEEDKLDGGRRRG